MSIPVQPGSVIAGKYEILHVMATGGMGIVVAARHLQLEQTVVLKFMRAELDGIDVSPDARERFFREGRAAVRLRGENVARVLDVGMLADNTPYIVMEHLEGTDLSDLVAKRGRLPLSEGVDYVLQACVAMAEAHKNGIVHRDLKPSNLFLTRRPDGSPLVKVLDFGISKVFHDAGTGADWQNTRTSAIMGSPAYMSPEQARSAKDADERSDIWSLGVILYELTSAALPYNVECSAASVLGQLLYELPRPLAQAAPSLPPGFCAVVDRCLNKDPPQRYRNVGELASALAPFCSDAGRAATGSVHAVLGNSAAAVSAPANAALSPAQVDTHADTQIGPQTGTEVDTLYAGLPAAAPLAKPAGTTPGMPAPVSAPPHPGQPDPIGTGIQEVELDAAPTAEPLVLALDLPGDNGERGTPNPGFAWLRSPGRLAGLALVLVLGSLTAISALNNNGVVLIDHLSNALHKFGYTVFDWAGNTLRLVAGTLVQLGLPALCVGVFRRWHKPVVALVCIWWLGASLVHVAAYMSTATHIPPPPLVGYIHTWSYLFQKWDLMFYADDAARIVYWLGFVLMTAAVAMLARRTWHLSSYSGL